MIWMNGTFGVGKTTTATLVHEALPESRLFDPEMVGQLLSAHLPEVEVRDFTELELWVPLVAEVAVLLDSQTEGELIAVQTVLDEDRWSRVSAGLRYRGLTVHHVVLDVDPGVLRDRIDRSAEAHQWRRDHVESWVRARRWLLHCADTVVDTTVLDATAVAGAVLADL